MISLDQFGANLKAKNPNGVASDGRAYVDIPNDEIGRLYVKAHPEYAQHIDDTASLVARVSGAIGERAKAIQDNKAAADTGSVTDVAQKTFQNAGEVAGGVMDVGTELAKSLDRTFAGGAVEHIVKTALSAIGETQTAQDVGSKLAEFAQAHPDAAKNVEAAVNILSLIPAFKGVKMAITGVTDATRAASVALRGGVEKVATKEIDAAAKFATEYAMPKATAKTAEAGVEQGRLVEPGIFSKGKLTPTPHDMEVGDSIAGIVSSKATTAQNIDAIRLALRDINAGVRAVIAERKVPFNRAQLRAQLETAKSDLNLVFASDATAEKIYNAVSDAFLGSLKKGDTLGLFDARQTFDQLPAIKKLLETSSLGENTRREIVLAVRRAANEYIAKQLPANNPYKAAMLKETRMLEALGNIAEKASTEIGKNKIQLLTNDYPILKYVAGGLVGAGGVGVGGALINSTD